ncbi:MAG: FAD-dependent thymidylate synthase [Candidatus Coprovivens sp.]
MKVVMLGNDSKEEIEKRLQIVASAGNLSRADGTVTQVFESNNDYEKNLKLARSVVGYGHKSIAEHDYIVFALEDVTPIIEQTIIGYRLTSFTIKSRRNVDFRNVGFYVPKFHDKDGNVLKNNKKLQKQYSAYMQSLFDKYGELVDEEIPVEDCRYILPYSYYSNIIMGCDANELLCMTSDMLYGKISNIPEIKELGEKLATMIVNKVPYLVRALDSEKEKDYYDDKYVFLDEMVSKTDIEPGRLLSGVILTDYTKNADWKVLCSLIAARYQVSMDDAAEILHKLSYQDSGIKRKIMQALIHSKNQRELEQVLFSFEIPISLAVLTHITRHRMHSLLVPDFVPLWDMGNYVIPETVSKNHKDEYTEIFSNNVLMVEEFKKQGVRDEDLVYFYLSGNACNIYTTMNGRTLEWISRMRCCNKAQWEIRNIANSMVSQASKVAPLIGEGLGPYCKVMGYCPEGKDSCKARGVVVLSKKPKNDVNK